MKKIPLEQLPQEVRAVLEAAQRERFLVTRDGVAYALIAGIENKDAEDLRLESSPEFWRMIEERRREPCAVTLEELLVELEAEEKREMDKKPEPAAERTA